ncbi:helix-turn-helix transcriptional regulator [Leeia sp. TBRC 13508]|uniref:Helix-turn-helix transcriptional regulator n=1 Tax=Leeia speluncae TaxID=2884804 RepID=A0ABS8D549_9NEIS|nr:helix-turn-helix transcriptional regulator [Leeia speluncae]MCB6183320.1 helix-turn-helix transcriptional regulator [Leeia speluncae]
MSSTESTINELSLLAAAPQLGQLLSALDRPIFLDRLFDWLSGYLPHQQMNLYRYVRPTRGEPVSAVEVLYWSSKAESLGDYPQLQAYVGKYWHEDPALDVIQHLAEPCLFVASTDQLGEAFLNACYPGGASQDCDLLCEWGDDVLLLALYRLDGACRFTMQELAVLRQLWAMISPMLVQHLQCCQREPVMLTEGLSLRFEQKLLRQRIQLSPKEYQTCLLLLSGQKLPAIAHELAVTANTARTYQQRAFQKLGVSNQAAFFAWTNA